MRASGQSRRLEHDRPFACWPPARVKKGNGRSQSTDSSAALRLGVRHGAGAAASRRNVCVAGGSRPEAGVRRSRAVVPVERSLRGRAGPRVSVRPASRRSALRCLPRIIASDPGPVDERFAPGCRFPVRSWRQAGTGRTLAARRCSLDSSACTRDARRWSESMPA